MARRPAPRRDDARRNRELILREADAAFSSDRDAVPLQEIARRAGLGRSTVYRHFPDRHALAAAVTARYLDALRAVVAAEEPWPFRDVLHWVLSTQVLMRPLSVLIRELPVADQSRYAQTLVGVLTPPFRAAQADRQVRADVEPAHLLLVLAMLDHAVEAERYGVAPAAVDQVITVLLDGLCGPAAPARPGRG